MQLFESADELARVVPEFLVKFLIAVLCGGAIGMERETSGKPAGLRTCILICVGSMIFTLMSYKIADAFHSDGARIAAQIVSGIGFLGAGAILHDKGGTVRGMTTAAMIWLMAGIGMMIAAGYGIIATALTIACVLMLLTLKKVERMVNRRTAVSFVFSAPDDPTTHDRVLAAVSLAGETVQEFMVVSSPDPDATRISFSYVGPSDERRELLSQLFSIPGIKLIERRKGR